ncbi:MAG: alpha-L-fucosidase [Dysgonamonadaceae bacterium]|jgi:alpha-L-fucosidase|nr:alpha-L-fucosidase [Dysgonamonadaceae bacterium]
MGKYFLFILYLFGLMFATYAQELSYINYLHFDDDTPTGERIAAAACLRPSPRQFEWQKMETIAFIHFGVNTFTGNEWGTGKENPQIFNPTQLDAEQWVETLKNAGFGLVILTAKHHDGFCLWQTEHTDHCVKNSLWKNGQGDVVKEVTEACAKHGVKFGFYLSPWDRNSTFFGSDAYNDYFTAQLTELLTGYGEVSEVWFDGANGEGPNGKRQVYDWERFFSTVRKWQPNAVIAPGGSDVRWVGNEKGYARETEWSVCSWEIKNYEQLSSMKPEEAALTFRGFFATDMKLGTRDVISQAKNLIWFPSESDVSIRPGWFYHQQEDLEVKTPETLFDIYCNSAGRNSVLLLNVPPDQRGLFHGNDVRNLLKFAEIRNKTFAENLLTGATANCQNGINIQGLADGDYSTFWTTADEDTTSVIDFTFENEIMFDLLLLQENIRIGQRIEQFRFEYLTGNEWKEIIGASTVGYKRILRFPPVRSNRLRLTIESSRLNPTLSEMGLYLQATTATNIKQPSIHTTATVYFNSEKLFVHTPLPGILNIYDLHGKLFFSENVPAGQTPIALKNGLYIVTLNGKSWKIQVNSFLRRYEKPAKA